MFINTTGSGTTVTIAKTARKEAGWCEANDVEHAWEVQDYMLTSDPPLSVRICLNCGKQETRANVVTLPEWR
jgi:hypothetical protein